MPDAILPADTISLGQGRKGLRGKIVAISGPAGGTLAPAELERRLLEMGFVEGAHIEILHEGFIGRDPIAVRVDDTTIALRRREAAGILVLAQS
jgi:ferrous iron transport protein A